MGASNIFNIFDKKAATPNIDAFKLPDFTQGLTDFNKQKDLIPGIQATATAGNEASNAAYQKSIFNLAPGLQGALSSLSNQANQLSQGIIPTDVANQVTRSAAYQGFIAGLGLDSNGLHGTQLEGVKARDLGRTSLQNTQLGSQLSGNVLGMAQQLTPNNLSVNQLLFSPSQLLSRADQQAQIDYGINSQNKLINFQNDQRVSPFTSLLQNTVSSFISKPFTQFQEIQNLEANMPNMAAGMAMSMCGGGKPSAPMGSNPNTGTSIPNSNFGTMFSGGTNPGSNPYSTGQQTFGGSANQWGVDAPYNYGGGGYDMPMSNSIANTPTVEGGGGAAKIPEGLA